MQILIGISIGWITMGVGVYFFLEYWNKKMFLDKPYKRKDKLFTDRIVEGFKEEFKNFKK